eukprot:scaffold2271_cov130-Cylindrotheca_fusiformis.AAC.26
MISVYFRNPVNFCCLTLLPVAMGLTPLYREFRAQRLSSALFTSSSSQHSKIVGGDYAGLAATFNAKDGSFVPIPAHFIPADLLEWGQEPRCLEKLVSEDLTENIDSKMERTIVDVLPSTGCGVDNLESMKTFYEINLNSMESDADGKVVGLQYPDGDNSFRLEAIFGLENNHRMRTGEKASGGTWADGGGLDGRTVSQLLGPELTKVKTFVDDGPLDDSFEDEGIHYLSLPGNVTVSHGFQSDNIWSCDISHTGDGAMRGVTLAAIVFGDGEIDFDMEAWNGER